MSLSRNAAYTMTSSLLQIGVTIFTIPIYLSVIGLERYGALVVIWLLFEYLTVFNLGLDRAAINFLSRHKDDPAHASMLFWTAMSICLVSGCAAAIFAYELMPVIMAKWLSVDTQLLSEIRYGFAALALLAIVSVLGSILSSLLQSHERFLELNIAQFVMSMVFQLLPVSAAILINPTLETVVIAGCIGRAVQTLIYLYFCFQPRRRPHAPKVSKRDGILMLRYGAWSSVSALVSPLVVNMDRIALSSVLGSAAVALYTIPYNLVMKAQLIPISLSSVLFPRLSQSMESESRLSIAGQALVSLAIVFAPGLILGSLILEPFLHLWVHQFVSKDAVIIGQILIVGIWFNGLAIIPFIWLQATGRPDVVAKIHTCEIIPFLAMLWVLVHQFGVVGAAVAWSTRVIIDALALFWMSRMPARLLTTLLIPFLCIVVSVTVMSLVTLSPGASALLALILFMVLAAWAVRSAPDAMRGKFESARSMLLPRRQVRYLIFPGAEWSAMNNREKRVTIVQYAGDFREASLRLSSGAKETYRAQRYTVHYVEGLATRVGSVTTITGFTDEAYDTILPSGARAIGAGFTKTWDSGEIARLIEKTQPTHLILRTPILPLLRKTVKMRLPVLAMLADSFHARTIKDRLKRFLTVRYLNAASVEGVANHGRNATRQLLAAGVDGRKLVAWDYPAFNRPQDRVPKSGPRGLKLIYVGMLSADKGVDDLLHALRHLRDEGFPAELDVVGSGEIERLQSLAATLGLKAHVHFLGKVPNDEIIERMGAADVVVVPSRHEYPEGLPLTIYEAYCSRTPLVASDHPMFLDNVTHEESGLVFKASDPFGLSAQLKRLLTDAELYARLSQNSVAAWERLQIADSWSVVIDKWLFGSHSTV